MRLRTRRAAYPRCEKAGACREDHHCDAIEKGVSKRNRVQIALETFAFQVEAN